MRNKQTTGFTLIELLVVIAIISLLVSILLPSLNRAKSLARNVHCMSNLRGLTLALQMYHAERGEVIPRARQTGAPWGYNGHFGILHNEGFAEDGFFVCPENGTPVPNPGDDLALYTPGPDPRDNHNGIEHGGYAANMWIMGWQDNNYQYDMPLPFGSKQVYLYWDAGYGDGRYPENLPINQARNYTFAWRTLLRLTDELAYAYPESGYSLRHGGESFNVSITDGSVHSFSLRDALGHEPMSEAFSPSSSYPSYHTWFNLLPYHNAIWDTQRPAD